MSGFGRIRKDGRIKSYFKGWGGVGGGGGSREGQPRKLFDKELWEIWEPTTGLSGPIVFNKREEAESEAVVWNKRYNAHYEARLVDKNRPSPERKLSIAGKVPDPETNKIYELLDTETVKYSVTTEPEGSGIYLSFAVRNPDNKDEHIAIRMSDSQMHDLVNYLHHRLG